MKQHAVHAVSDLRQFEHHDKRGGITSSVIIKGLLILQFKCHC